MYALNMKHGLDILLVGVTLEHALLQGTCSCIDLPAEVDAYASNTHKASRHHFTRNCIVRAERLMKIDDPDDV